MDKSDVEMEDAIKGPQDLENAGKQTQNHSVDGKVEGDGKELPHSAAGGDSKPSELGTEESNKAKSHDITDQNNSKSDLEVLKSKKSEAGDGNNMPNKEVEEAEDPNGVRSQEVKDAQDPNDVRREEVKEVEDSNNVRSEEVKEAKDLENVRSEGVQEAGDPEIVKGEGAKEVGDVNNETRGVKGEVEDRHNDKSEAKSEKSKIGSEANEDKASENGGHGKSSSKKIEEEQKHGENAVLERNPSEQGPNPVKLAANEAPKNEIGVAEEVQQGKDEAKGDIMVAEPKESDNKTASVTAMTDGDAEVAELQETRIGVNNTGQNVNEEMVDVAKDPENKTAPANAVADGNVEMCATPITKREVDGTPVANHHEPAIPTAMVNCSTVNAASHSGETYKNFFNESKMPGNDDGTPEEQAAFMKELESFYRERALEFKPPRFYGQQLNCLKLWRAVIRLGGYDRVTGSKLWRQVGESFHPPKTCTTVSWTFRIFYEKALLEYERYKRESGELQLPLALPDPSGGDTEGNGYLASGSGRARRDAAARAMQGWHAQRLFGSGEVSEPTTKDKNFNNMPKREKNLKSIGSLKQKRPNEVEHPVKAARTETSKQLVASVVDVGPPADWVKINVRETKDCFEVYALVPGLLREEVRVQSDPAGRLVITGQPEQLDNPWGITAFKKVVSLPGRIDPLQTSAVVSLHGRLFVRVPFEQSNI